MPVQCMTDPVSDLLVWLLTSQTSLITQIVNHHHLLRTLKSKIWGQRVREYGPPVLHYLTCPPTPYITEVPRKLPSWSSKSDGQISRAASWFMHRFCSLASLSLLSSFRSLNKSNPSSFAFWCLPLLSHFCLLLYYTLQLSHSHYLSQLWVITAVSWASLEYIVFVLNSTLYLMIWCSLFLFFLFCLDQPRSRSESMVSDLLLLTIFILWFYFLLVRSDLIICLVFFVLVSVFLGTDSCFTIFLFFPYQDLEGLVAWWPEWLCREMILSFVLLMTRSSLPITWCEILLFVFILFTVGQ